MNASLFALLIGEDATHTVHHAHLLFSYVSQNRAERGCDGECRGNKTKTNNLHHRDLSYQAHSVEGRSVALFGGCKMNALQAEPRSVITE